MGTTVEKLTKVLETKEAIRTSINNKGGTLTESDTFSSYSTAIDNIQTGSGENPLQEVLDNQEGDGNPSCNRLFYYYKGTSLDNALKSLDFSKVTSMSGMFYNCINLTSIPVLDTSKITDMSTMFSSCSNLTTIPVLDTSNVTNMSYMFGYCNHLTSMPVLDTSKVTDMSRMFYSCIILTSIPQLDTSSVTDMSQIFYNCWELKEIHMTGMKVNFNISASTKFTESALVEILNNLATVTSTQTLTMGSTNLAKLTDEEKAIATNKGWTLAERRILYDI